MKVTVYKHPTEVDWMLCKMCALKTAGLKVKNPPDEAWKYKMLNARHSPIRVLEFLVGFEDLPYWVSTHLVRHVHAIPFVRSQRNDRQEQYDRTKAPQDAPVEMLWYINAEEMMVIANKRLCAQASKETREAVQMLCDEILKTNPEFEPFLVPACVRENGVCHEVYPCGRWER